MKRLGVLVALVVGLLSVNGLAFGETCDTVGCTYTASWTEPSQYQSGAPLTDLTKSTLYWKIGTANPQSKDIPATKPAGGGSVSTTVTIPIAPGQGPITVVFWATASNPYGESPKSNEVTKTKDRSQEVPSKTPTNLLITWLLEKFPDKLAAR